MRKPISPTVHGVMDYLSVPLLLLAPQVFGFAGKGAQITSTAAGVVLAYSAVTAYRLGIVKMISFRVHGAIDLVLGIAFIAAHFFAAHSVLGLDNVGTARNFFALYGFALVLVVSLTDFSESAHHGT